MFVFLKKRILVETNNEAVTKAIEALKKNKINYELRTIRSRGSVGSGLDAQAYARSNISMYKGSSLPSFVYMVYVRRKDYLQAKKAISTKS